MTNISKNRLLSSLNSRNSLECVVTNGIELPKNYLQNTNDT